MRLHCTDPKPQKLRKLCDERTSREHNRILEYAMYNIDAPSISCAGPDRLQEVWKALEGIRPR